MPEQPPVGPDQDPAFESLRNADPVARADVDADAATRSEESIRAEVRSRLAEQAQPQRRRPWLTVAAAAAAAVIIGGGGYWVGSAATGTPAPTAAGTTDVSVSIEAAPGSGEIMAAPEAMGVAPNAGGAQSRDTMSQTSAGSDAAKMSAIWSGRTEFTQQGLSTDAPADGEVSAITPAAADPAVLAAAGAVIGATGEPRDTSVEGWASWSIGAEDGTGPTGYLDATGNLSLQNPAAWQDWNNCAATGGNPEPAIDPPVADSDIAVDPTIDIMPVEPCAPAEPLPPLDQAAADATIQSVLTAAGLDPASFTITWSEDAGDGQRWALADPGWLPASDDAAQRLGQWAPGSWNFNFIGNTLSSANGVIATLAPTGTYQLISPAAAVERLSDPRFGAPSMVAQPETGEQAWAPVPPGTFAGGPIPWPVAQMTITSAELQQSALTLSNSVTLIAPTYRLSTADGYVWEVSAIADSGFDFTS